MARGLRAAVLPDGGKKRHLVVGGHGHVDDQVRVIELDGADEVAPTCAPKAHVPVALVLEAVDRPQLAELSRKRPDLAATRRP